MATLELVHQQTIGLNNEALEEFVEHRKEIKRPLTPLAIKKAVKRLMQFNEDDQQLMVDQAILSGWVTVYPPKRDDQKPTVTGDTAWLDQTRRPSAKW